MNKVKNELLQFVAGIVMLVVGLFILSQKVIVYSGWFGMMSIGGFRVSSGLVIIPFIAGIIWMFATGASFASKIFTVLSVLLIIVSIILSTNIHLTTITLYEWILILVLIFGGVGFIAKVLFASNNHDSDNGGRRKNKKMDQNNNSAYSVEDDLEQLKKNLK